MVSLNVTNRLIHLSYLIVLNFSYLCLFDFVGRGAPSSSKVILVFLRFNRETLFLAKVTRDINSSFDMS